MLWPYCSAMRDVSPSTVGCTFSSDDAAITAICSLSSSGAASGWRVGASDVQRAAKIAAATDAKADLDLLDPLAGAPGLISGGRASEGVNRGAVLGGAAGALAGIVAGPTPLASIMPVDPSFRTVAATLLFFAIGVAVGGVLGGAFGPRPSAHAGFRLIDAMEAGEIAAIAIVDSNRVDEVRNALESAGAADIIAIDASAP